MIKSMTGFGRGEYGDEKRTVLCEVRSVNHRYLDVSAKMPRRYAFAEDAVRGVVKDYVRRGKVDLSFTVDATGEEDMDIHLNHALAKRYAEELRQLGADLGYDETPDLEYLCSLPDVLKIQPRVEEEESLIRAMVAAAEEALKAHRAMRETEGARLREDMQARGETILKWVGEIEARGPEMLREYSEKMKERLADFLEGQAEIGPERIAAEAAIFADKCNITEEIVRLRSHVAQMNEILNSDQAEGKKLDFLIQEMNREANTIGSKANDMDITSRMLELKNEVEKIREQVQNIE